MTVRFSECSPLLRRSDSMMKLELIQVVGHCTVLDKIIDEGAEIFRQYYEVEEFGDPSMQSQVCLFPFSPLLLPPFRPSLSSSLTGRHSRLRPSLPRNRHVQDIRNLNLARVLPHARLWLEGFAQV